MPFKKYQSLTDNLAQNKRLSKRRRGLRWTPPASSLASGLHGDSRTQHGVWHVACFPARGCWLIHLLSSEGDNNCFPCKDDAPCAPPQCSPPTFLRSFD